MPRPAQRKICPACNGRKVMLVPKLIKGKRVRVEEPCAQCKGTGEKSK